MLKNSGSCLSKAAVEHAQQSDKMVKLVTACSTPGQIVNGVHLHAQHRDKIVNGAHLHAQHLDKFFNGAHLHTQHLNKILNGTHLHAQHLDKVLSGLDHELLLSMHCAQGDYCKRNDNYRVLLAQPSLLPDSDLRIKVS